MGAPVDRVLDRALNVRPGEGPKVAFMALYAANAIGAVVVGRTVRDTLFLADRTKDDLPVMYIVNAVAVALLAWLYARYADRVRRDQLNTIVAAGWAVILLGFYGLVALRPRAVAPVLYVAVEAMGSLVVIQFWTFAQDVFTSREAKRLFPIISAGGQAANVVYGFLAASVSKRVSAESLLILCALNLCACALLARYIGARFGSAIEPAAATARSPDRSPLNVRSIKALATPHLLTVAAIAVLGAVVVNLVDYQFKAAAEAHYSVDKQAMGAYFGRFYGICGAFALALQMGLTGRILARFGVLASLLPLPIGLALGSTFAWAFPSGWTASLAKGSDSIFRYTINDAQMQLLYVPVPSHQRGRAKALIDGVLRPLAGVVAGVVLVLLGRGPLLRGLKGITAHGRVESPNGIITLLILGLCAGWIWLVWARGHREYLRSLVESLKKPRLDPQFAALRTDQSTAEAIGRVLHSDDALAILNALQLLREVEGRDFGPLVAELLDHRVSSVRAAAADYLASKADRRYAEKLRATLADRDPWCVAASVGAVCALEREAAIPIVAPMLNDPRPALRAAAVVGLVRHCGVNGMFEAADELKRLMAATSTAERELAASVLGALGLPTFSDALQGFLGDRSPSVRRAALHAAGRMKTRDLVVPIVKMLRGAETGRDAARALVAFGPGVEPALASVARDEGEPPQIRAGVLAVLGRVGTREAGDVLQSCLEIGDPNLRAAAARALARLLRRRPEIPLRRDVVRGAVLNEIATAERLADVQRGLQLPVVNPRASIRSEPASGGDVLLALTLTEEREQAMQRALALLELLHPNAGLEVVADNLRSDSPSRRSNAVEVLDNTLREDFKRRLLPVVEGHRRALPPSRRPGEWISELVEGPNAWIAACAARVAGELKLPETLAALRHGLRSPIAYVRESSAAAVAKVAPAEAPALLDALRDDPAPGVRLAAARLLARPLTAVG